MMKQIKNHIVTASLLVCCAFLTLCSDDKDDLPVISNDTTVFIENNGLNNLQIYDKGDEPNYSFELELRKSGNLKNSVAVKLEVVMTAELNQYNAKTGTDFVRLPSRAYDIEKMEVYFSPDETDASQKVRINFILPEMDMDMTNRVLSIKIAEADANVDAERSVCVIHPQVVNASFSLKSPQIQVFDIGDDDTEVLQFDIETILDIDENAMDVAVEIDLDSDFIERYNQENGTDYSFPAPGTYSLEETKTLPAGEKEMSFQLEVSAELLEKSCIFPVKLKSSSRYFVDNEDFYVLIFDVTRKVPELLDRSQWTIAGFNTEEAVGEDQGRNGRAIHAIDGRNDTYWHSQWRNGSESLPHWFTIDMHESFTLTQVLIAGRQGFPQSKAGNIYISPDNENWTKIGDFVLEQVDDAQAFLVEKQPGRYLRIELTESYRVDGVSALSEVMAIGY